MRQHLVVVLSLLTLGAAQAPKHATVEGIVLRMGTSEPVANVDVVLTTSSPMTPTQPSNTDSKTIRAKTDPAGRFVFSDLDPGLYNLAARRDGFIRQRRSGPTNIIVAAGQQVKDIRVSLTPTGTLSGRVIDRNGEPRTMSIEILSESYHDGVRGLIIERGNIKTDDRGQYRVTNLAPGKYYLRAMPIDGEVAFEPSYYPGVPSPDEALPLTVGGGADVAQVNWQLLTRNLHVVKVKVTGMLPGNTNVMFFPQPKGSGRIAMGGRQTPFEKIDDTWLSPPLAPGSYEVGIVARPPNPPLGTILTTRGQWAAVRFEVRDEDIDLGTVTMKPGYAITGHVVGQIAPNMRVRLAFIGVGTLPLDVVSAPASIAEDGTFTLTEVKEQRFKVELQSLPASAYIDSATYKGLDVLNDGIFVDGEVGLLEVSIATGGGVQGVTTNAKDEPIAGVRVVLIPSADRRGSAVRFPSVMSDESGAFSFSGLRPGNYGVLAIEDNALASDTYWEDPDFLKEYEIRSKNVSVTRGTSSSLTIRTITVPGK